MSQLAVNYEIPTQTAGLPCAPWENEDIGTGNESGILFDLVEQLRSHYGIPYTRMRNDPAIRFNELKIQWEQDIRFLSSLTDICMHPAYQQIIGMGKTAIPLIIKELSSEPSHWFWALKAITGEDPVPPGKRGKIKEMAKVWVLWWARQKFYRHCF